MENNSIAKLILGFVVLIVGVSLIGSIATQTNDAIDLIGVANETFNIGVIGEGMVADGCSGGSINITHPYTIVNAPTSGWQQAGGCPIAGIVIRNQTRNTAVVNTDYVFNVNNGTFYLLNTTRWVADDCSGTGAVTNVTEVDYLYCADGYLNISWGRAILTLVSGFFAIALLAVGVGLFYSVARDSGILSSLN